MSEEFRPEEFRIDESRGDVYDQVADRDTGATGYPDRIYLRRLNTLAHSQEVPDSVSSDAQRTLGKIAATYGLHQYAEIIKREHPEEL